MLTYIKRKAIFMNVIGFVLLIVVLLLASTLFTSSTHIAHSFEFVCLLILCSIFVFAFLQPSKYARNKIFAFFVLLIISIIFWAICMLIPSELGFFLNHSTRLATLGIDVYKHGYEAIISLTVLLCAPFIGALFFKLRLLGKKVFLPLQFALGMLFIGLAVFILPLSLHSNPHLPYISHVWLITAYVLTGLAQLLIQPIGLAMVGQLAPVAVQGIFMGIWMMILGIASYLTAYFSKNLHNKVALLDTGHAVEQYRFSFHLLGASAFGIALLVILLLPLLNRLIHYRSLNPALNKNKEAVKHV